MTTNFFLPTIALAKAKAALRSRPAPVPSVMVSRDGQSFVAYPIPVAPAAGPIATPATGTRLSGQLAQATPVRPVDVEDIPLQYRFGMQTIAIGAKPALERVPTKIASIVGGL